MSNDTTDSLDDVIATVDELIAWYGAAIPFDAVIALRVRLAALQVHCKLNASPPISGAEVPDELLWEPGDLQERDDYREGWNDCRAAMLADQPAKGGV